jgi:ferredoxin hydrogenase small subunit
MIDWVRQIASRARHVVAIGSCSSWGGITAAGMNPTDACGLQYDGEATGGLLGPEFRDPTGLPVINVAGCPPHPDWITETLAALAHGRLRAEHLDDYGRPRFFADQLVHHGCPRNEYYEFKASASRHSEQGCLMEQLGCKGTQAHADCNQRLWNGEGSCLRGGYACIRCTDPGFEEPGHPFETTPKVAGIPLGLPSDMPKAWFIALAALSKSATPARVRENAHSDHLLRAPSVKRTKR